MNMCCGKNRQQFANPAGSMGVAAAPGPIASSAAAGVPAARPRFEYTGNTALTVVGPHTGKHYRFPQPGARLEVDPRDRSWIAFVPHLKRCA